MTLLFTRHLGHWEKVTRGLCFILPTHTSVSGSLQAVTIAFTGRRDLELHGFSLNHAVFKKTLFISL